MDRHFGNKYPEGLSTTRPPYFDGIGYNFWKQRMRIFLSASDFEVWQIVEDGFTIPKSPRDTWTNEEKKASTLNARAMNALFCALNEVEYNRVSLCTSAKDIWVLLQVTHEGTNQVKESKIGALTQKYELFKMLEDENISKMYTRFNDIIVQLQGLSKHIPSIE